MSMDSVIDLGKACGRELSEAEAARLREIGNSLNLREDDALWPLLAAMEYQRVYYEALPDKIAGASRAIMDGMAAAAEKETATAQARLTDSVVEEARNLASKIQYGKLVPMWLLALICLLAYGSLMLWAGFRIDTGRNIPLVAILHMPSGWLISGLCLAAGLFCGVLSAKSFVEEKKGIWKQGISALLLIFTGCSMFVYLITY
ncbi:hypothetical protein [Bilophila wadsworthia]|jgi:type VI protein secretion system component VasF|uniref:hypothetical protein n=1 Tax=Bilophila wadsworthia TaxID=35833 RepID=UPI00266C99D1|nr:hypothetical protein [Bilophila wadsworthia]